jgi:D-alanine-D-alanine ligase
LAARNLIYTGCPAAALKLALHKAQAKDRLRECGIPTPDYQVLSNDNLYTFKLKFPCIVKPLGEDASHGITTSSVVHNALELSRQLARVSTGYNGDVLVEEFVTGREFNATVLDDGVLPISEIIYTLPANMPWLLTYDAKWQPGVAITAIPMRCARLQSARLSGARQPVWRWRLIRPSVARDMPE